MEEVTEKEGKRRKEGGGFMADKLKRGVLVGLRGGPSTPPPTWKLELSSSSVSHLHSGCKNDTVREFVDFPHSTISARKLCANLWELQPHHLQIQTPLPSMTKPAKRIRRRHHKGEHPQGPTDEPASPSSLSRHVATLPVESHRSVDRDGCVSEPLSPASYSGSLEVAQYNNQAVTPTSSFNLKGRRMGESSCNIETTRELLKALNRIWSLEEHHASSISVVKALKMELDLSHARVKELVREKQMDRQGMEDLVKRITEDKLVRKNMKEFDKIKAAFQSVKEELEDERRLRKHSESRHRKLARELSQTQSSFSGSLRGLERERKARILLENLCDEFAKGIRAYEQEVRSMRRLKSEKGQFGGRDHSLDRLILHISEAWLDERAQMKVGDDPEERSSSIVDKLGFDIETFLHATRCIDSKQYGNSSPKELKEIYPCQNSLDSFPLKESTSAPRNVAEEDSIGANFSDLKIAELNSVTKQVLRGEDFTKSSNFQENMSHGDGNESWFIEGKPSELRGDTKTVSLTVCEATQGPQESDRAETRRMSSSHQRLDNMVGNSLLSSEGDKIHPESICREDSQVQSVVEERKSKLSVSDLSKREPFLKLPGGVKENTLMAKLIEARLEAQKSRSRTSKSSFRSTREISDKKITDP